MNAKYPRLSRALEPFVNAIPLLALLELATEIVTSNTAVSRYHGLLWVLEGSSELWSMHGTSATSPRLQPLQVEEIRTPMPDDGEPIAVMLLRPRDAGIEAAEDDVPMQRAS